MGGIPTKLDNGDIHLSSLNLNSLFIDYSLQWMQNSLKFWLNFWHNEDFIVYFVWLRVECFQRRPQFSEAIQVKNWVNWVKHWVNWVKHWVNWRHKNSFQKLIKRVNRLKNIKNFIWLEIKIGFTDKLCYKRYIIKMEWIWSVIKLLKEKNCIKTFDICVKNPIKWINYPEYIIHWIIVEMEKKKIIWFYFIFDF